MAQTSEIFEPPQNAQLKHSPSRSLYQQIIPLMLLLSDIFNSGYLFVNTSSIKLLNYL